MSRPVDVLRQWGRRGVERLGASDDRPAALACALVGAAAVWCALPPSSALDDTAVGTLFVVRHFWPVAAVGAVLSVAPKRWHHGLQSAALAALFVSYELEEPGGLAKNSVTIAMWACSILLAWKLPLHNDRLRKSLIVVVTASLPLLARRLSFEQGVVLVQFLFACAVLARRESRSLVDCQRATSALRVMMPPTDLLASNRSGASISFGAVLIVAGLLGFRAFDRVASCGISPFYFCEQSLALSIADAVWLHPRLASLAWAALRDVVWIANYALQYAILTGVLNLIGVPMRFMTGNMLRVRSLFDYWKIANRWQYELLRTVYLDDFFAIRRGWTAALGIVLVFLISGLLHLPGRVTSTESLARTIAGSEARWLVFGVLCAGSYQWMVYSVRRRLQSSLRGAKPARWGALFAKASGAPLLFSVLSVSGLMIAADEVFGAAQPYWIVSNAGPEGFRKPELYRSLAYGGPTRPAEKLPTATTGFSPAIASFDDSLYAAWQDPSTARIQWAKLDGRVWSAPRPIEGASTNASPALATLGRRLFAVWTNAARDGSIGWASLEGGVWALGGRMGDASASGPPGLAALGDRLYAAWTAGHDAGIQWATFDGQRWTSPQRLHEGPGASPALTQVNGRLHAAWRGSGLEDRTLWWTSFDGKAWARAQPVPGAEAGSGPALTALGGRLEVAWRGVGLDADIQWASYDGTWAPPARTGLFTCDRPAMASHRGYLVFAWRGREASRCESSSDFGGSWDLSSVYFVDVPRSSSSPSDTLGRIVWRSLRTTDPGAAAAFYAHVVGWHATDDAGYVTLAGTRGALGGILRISKDEQAKGVRPHWAPTIAVSDVDATSGKVVSAGGRAHLLYDKPDGVRYGLLSDPTGAAIDVATLTGAATLHDSSEPGDFHGFLFTTPDASAALRFYGDVFDWRAALEPDAPPEAATPSITRLEVGRARTELGMMRVVPADAVGWWLFYVEVRDLDAAIGRALSGGGKVWFGPTLQPDGGRTAELVDAQGAPFGLHEPRAR